MSESLPHPKKLSVEAAKSLQVDKAKLPDSAQLRTASEYDPSIHVENEELVRTKAERFAILAHLAEEISKETIVNTGRETRFYHRIKPSDYSLKMKLQSFVALENDLFDDESFGIIAKEVLREKRNALIVERFNSIAGQIFAHPASKDDEFYGKDDTIESRLGGLTYDVVVNTLLMMKIIKKHIQEQYPELNSDSIREIMLDNIDFLEEIANKNLIHNNKLVHVYFPEDDGSTKEVDTAFEFTHYYAETELVKVDGTYKLKLYARNPKPKVGLYGATMGCPANYHITEGDTVIRKYATAIINEAYDRGLLAEPLSIQ